MRFIVAAVIGLAALLIFRRRGAGVPALPVTQESFNRLQEIQLLSFSASNNTLDADKRDRFLSLLSDEFGPDSAEVVRFTRIFYARPPSSPE